jgi:hypothetical protein
MSYSYICIQEGKSESTDPADDYPRMQALLEVFDDDDDVYLDRIIQHKPKTIFHM